MLEESGKMIADSASRLGAAVQELRDLLVSPCSTFALGCGLMQRADADYS